MRTTIVIDDLLWPRLKGIALKKRLSQFINACLREHLGREERTRRMRALEKSYQHAARSKKTTEDFDVIDREEWPEW